MTISQDFHRPLGRPKSSKKREAILNAASTLFLKEGFELTSMDKIASLAGVSKLTIYSHFADKEGIFRAAVEKKCDETNRPLDYEAMFSQSPHDALYEIGLRFAGFILSREGVDFTRMMMSESMRHPKLAKIFYEAAPKRGKEALSRLLGRWVELSVLRIDDCERGASEFFSLIKGDYHFLMMLGLIEAPSESERRTHVKSSVDFFVGYYGQMG